MIKTDLSKSGPGIFNVPSMMRITLKRSPRPRRMGINPFTKEQVMFKAKPARNVVRVRPLKALGTWSADRRRTPPLRPGRGGGRRVCSARRSSAARKQEDFAAAFDVRAVGPG
jgi:hypothetical protein